MPGHASQTTALASTLGSSDPHNHAVGMYFGFSSGDRAIRGGDALPNSSQMLTKDEGR